MRTQFWICVGAFVVLWLRWAEPAAAAPWNELFSRQSQRLEAEAGKTYPLTAECGDWLIVAATFHGETSEAAAPPTDGGPATELLPANLDNTIPQTADQAKVAGNTAQQQADALCLELRKRYKLEAYTHARVVDLSGNIQGLGVDRFGSPRQMKYKRDKTLLEVAVLVGHYNGVDDPLAQKTLKQLKQFRPESVKELEQSSEVVKGDDVDLTGFRNVIRQSINWKTPKGAAFKNIKHNKGLMANAFLAPNPLRYPEDADGQQRRKPIATNIAAYNLKVPHNLFTNPGKYTVIVATFQGATLLDQKKVQAALASAAPDKKQETQLERAFDDANRMCDYLRKKGYEAYVFHDHHSSMVCVGGYDWVSRNLPGGTSEMNPLVKKTIEVFGQAYNATPYAKGGQQPQQGQGAVVAKCVRELGGLLFDVNPTPVEVPRKPVMSTEPRSLVGRR